jgi:hypothetical protein
MTMNAICGACGKKHDTIGEYRDCAGVAEEAAEAQSRMDALTGETTRVSPPSDKQVSYVMDLLLIHDWPDQISKEDLAAMERKQVSALITAIQRRPLKRKVPEGQPADGRSPRPQSNDWMKSVPPGRYAVKQGQYWYFYEVQRSDEGAWAGYTFVKMLIGAPGSYRKQKLSGSKATEVLRLIIEMTPREASLAYGRETEVCGICGSDLSNAESIKLGIGPVCIKKMGW